MTARTLVLLRHAKAERPGGLPDVDRPLTERGHADASAAGAWLSTHGHGPDLVICSPAKRTRQTWHGIAVALADQAEIRYEKHAYDGSARDLLSLLTTIDAGTATVLVIGHNPAVSHLSVLLAPDGGAADSDGLRTCGLAVHEVPGPWDKLARAPLLTSHTARA